MDSSLYKKALYLTYFTVGYNIFEGIFSILAGWLAGSIALIGFGLDSFVESTSGCIVLWRFLKHGKVSKEEEERIEKRAVRFVGASFFLLAAYVTFESVKTLYQHEHPEPSLFGIVIAALSLVIMPVLSYLKYSTAGKLMARSLEADSKQTFICSLLSAALFVGLGLNYLYGYWWADPMAALVIVAFIVREGVVAFKEGKACCQ